MMSSTISLLSVSPPPALVASRARRQRSNAISRALESDAEWNAAGAPDPPTTATSAMSPPSWRDDELICPLARRAHTDPHAHPNAKAPLWVPVPVWPADEGELQAVLAQFAFPASGRKHRRSGEIVVDNSPTSSVGPVTPAAAAAASSGKRRGAPGPNRGAWCAHCERGRSGA